MKNWIFDLDGTLVDSFGHYFETLTDLFQEHGTKFAPELRLVALTDPLPLFFERHLGKEAVPSALEKLQKRSNGDALKVRPFHGALFTVESLFRSGRRVAIWTNRDLESAQIILKQTGLHEYADLCVSGTCVAQRKPHPEGFYRILEHFGCKAEEVTIVGDHEHDVLAAKNVGARAVRASWHQYWSPEKCTQADHQFFSFDAFAEWAL